MVGGSCTWVSKCVVVAAGSFVVGVACHPAVAPTPGVVDAPALSADYGALDGDYLLHVHPQRLAVAPSSPVLSASALLQEPALYNRGILMGQGGDLRAPSVGPKPYLFANAVVREALDGAQDVWVSYRGVGTGDALAIARGVSPSLAVHLQNQAVNRAAFRDGPGTVAGFRWLHNDLGQILVLHEDTTWFLASAEARNRLDAILPQPPSSIAAFTAVAALRLSGKMLDAHLRQGVFASLSVHPSDLRAELQDDGAWRVTAVFGSAAEATQARSVCDATLASLHSDDPSVHPALSASCEGNGLSLSALLRLPSQYSYGLSVQTHPDAGATVTPMLDRDAP
jgi:hypothetical protein